MPDISPQDVLDKVLFSQCVLRTEAHAPNGGKPDVHCRLCQALYGAVRAAQALRDGDGQPEAA